MLVSESNTVTAIQTPQTTAQTVKCVLGHADRTDLGREFGATDVVAERGEEGVERVRKLTGGDGTHTVLECVGLPACWRARIESGRVFDQTVNLEDIADGYRAMADRKAIKVIVEP